MADETDVRFAVENMFPLRARGREVTPYAPDWDPTDEDFPRLHARPVAHRRSRSPTRSTMAATMGDRLAHVHIADGDGHGPRRAPGAGPRHPAVRRAARGARRAAASTGWSWSRSTPAGPRTGPSARPTSPRRWPSPASTWRRRRRCTPCSRNRRGTARRGSAAPRRRRFVERKVPGGAVEPAARRLRLHKASCRCASVLRWSGGPRQSWSRLAGCVGREIHRLRPASASRLSRRRIAGARAVLLLAVDPRPVAVALLGLTASAAVLVWSVWRRPADQPRSNVDPPDLWEVEYLRLRNDLQRPASS